METQKFTNHKPLDLTPEEKEMLTAIKEAQNISEQEAETILDNWKHGNAEIDFHEDETLENFIDYYSDFAWNLHGYRIPEHVSRKLILKYILPEILIEELRDNGFIETSTGTIYIESV
ncbi:MAG: hypothetical protein LBR79_00255 [Oscillospiraceae bacterium]|nr:hypothetical protein [Oscillospiraceae bacterium]